jgi:hypothetical protein
MIIEKWPLIIIFHMMGVGVLIGIYKRTPWSPVFVFKVLTYFFLVHLALGFTVFLAKNYFPGEWESMKPKAQEFDD